MNRYEPSKPEDLTKLIKQLEEGKPQSRVDAGEPPPEKNNHPCAQDCVAADLYAQGNGGIARDIMARKAKGVEKYGTQLQPCNGRNNVMDLYQELLDAANYAKTEILETEIEGKDNRTELQGIYERCLDLLEDVYFVMHGGYGNDGAKGCPSDPAF